MKNEHFFAEFDFDSFLIRVIENGDDSSIESLFVEDNDCEYGSKDASMDILLKAYYSKYKKEYLPERSLDALPQEVRELITHENLHLIQAYSYVFIIKRFLDTLKLRRYHAKSKNMPRFRLFADTLLTADDNYSLITSQYSTDVMNFNYFKDLGKMVLRFAEEALREIGYTSKSDFLKYIEQKTGVIGIDLYRKFYNTTGLNIISDDPPTAMIFSSMPHLEEGQIFYFYVAILDYCFPIEFTVITVMESMTYISEKILKDEKIGEINLFDEESRKYLGVWEFYRRFFNSRYDSEKELALSYLAFCDLALTMDIMPDENEFYYEEDRLINSNFPYRFGQIIYKAQNFDTLKLMDNDPEKSIVLFQDKYCAYVGFTSVGNSIKKMILHLIKVLLLDLCYLTPVDDRKMINNLHNVQSDLDNNWKLIDVVLSDLNLYRSNVNEAISIAHNTLGTMLNTLVWKLDNRHNFVLPLLHLDEIKRLFPSPYVLYKGEFYASWDRENVLVSPYRIEYMSKQQDYLLLFLSKSLISGESDCAFLSQRLTCCYVENGLGCPLKGLSKENNLKRECFEDKNWCYWVWYKKILAGTD